MARLDGRDARQTEQSEGEAEGSESTTGESDLLGAAKARSWVGAGGNGNIDACGRGTNDGVGYAWGMPWLYRG